MNRRRFLAALAAPVVAAGGFMGWRSMANPYYSGPKSDHFDGLRFFIDGYTQDRSPLELLRWQFGRQKAQWPQSVPGTRTTPPARVEGGTLRVTMVGHATLLVQTYGLNILIDPVWGERASPFTFAGPKRVNAPGIGLPDLPPLDYVLVSHNHYDHLDLGTLRELAQRHAQAQFLTPLGNDQIMKSAVPVERIQCYDWDQKHDMRSGVAVHFEPSYHWSARGLLDRRMALWAAFVITTPSGNVYHIADTGFSDGAIFARMREKYRAFRLAIIPIGAYEPRWFMKDHHINPAESVKVFQLCGADQALAHHWGTFQLTDEPHDEPPRRLAEALAQEKIDPARFAVKRPGEVLELAAP